MDAEIVNRLIKITRDFYSRFAAEFSETRSSGKINLRHILPYLSQGSKVLDVGCGNGRLAQRLDHENIRAVYLGIDSIPELIEIASSARLRNLRATFRLADISQSGWNADLKDYDIATALAVLHHIPSFDLRAAVLRDIRATLKPAGFMLMTNWKFDENVRLRRKVIPWDTVDLDEQALEPGDALIAWQRGGTGYRYVHLITPNEVERLALSAEFKVEKQFYGDAGLNLYSILSVVKTPREGWMPKIERL
jgi:2-polyprenyl-3-methyl-5-hydroxy-6-metoxy-1,4-benzoquinol methylase